MKDLGRCRMEAIVLGARISYISVCSYRMTIPRLPLLRPGACVRRDQAGPEASPVLLAPAVTAARLTRPVSYPILYSGWMKPVPVAMPLAVAPAVSEYVYEPYGVCLVMGAFNYPIQLTVGPARLWSPLFSSPRLWSPGSTSDRSYRRGKLCGGETQ